MALVRLLALTADAYLLVVMTVVLVGGAVGHRPSLALATRVTPPRLRPLLAVATTVTIAAGIAGPGAEAAPRTVHPPTLRWLGPSQQLPAIPPTPPPAAPPRTATPGRGGTAGPVASVAAPARRDARPARRSPTATVRDRAAGRHRPPLRPRGAPTHEVAGYVVRHGDDFWSIAAVQVRIHNGGTAEPAQIARYWKLLVQANAANLPVPGQPDLLFAGDRLAIPPVP
jgi:hypothetical protein